MNRSFRASAAEPQATRGRTLESMMKDKEDDLALFLEMRKRDKERSSNLLLLIHSSESDELDPPLGSKRGSCPLFKIGPSTPARKAGFDDFLNSDSEKNDYDWLLTPPDTPLFPSLETESTKSPICHVGTPKSRQTMLKSRLSSPADTSSRSTFASRLATSLPALNPSGVGTRRPSSSGGLSTASRPATPTGRSTVAATSKPSRPSTPTSRATVPSNPLAPLSRSSSSAKSSTFITGRSSMPAAVRSSTSTSTSTSTSRPSLSAPNRPASRSATPTRRPSTPSSLPASSAPPGRSYTVTKSGPTISKSSTPSCSSSAVRSRPWKPLDMPGFSIDAPPNLKTSLSERPSSASWGRAGAPISRTSSAETEPNVRPRQQSCSPSRGRASNGIAHGGSSIPAISRSRLKSDDSANPVLIGSKMVERVVSVRRLAPPKQDDQRSSSTNSHIGKLSSSPDSTGFGRSLSKKSLDMALRHMDIRRSIPSSFRPSTNIPTSSMYSMRSGPTRSRPVSVSDSPLTTSSNASSEYSFSNYIPFMDGNEIEYDLDSEKGGSSSPAACLPDD